MNDKCTGKSGCDETGWCPACRGYRPNLDLDQKWDDLHWHHRFLIEHLSSLGWTFDEETGEVQAPVLPPDTSWHWGVIFGMALGLVIVLGAASCVHLLG